MRGGLLKLWMLLLTGLVWIVLTPHGVLAQTDEHRSWFEAANTAYRDGRYEEAVQLYNRIIDTGWMSSTMMFNIGNSHYRLNQPGDSILWYERARFLAPRDSDIRFNLRYVRQAGQSTSILDDQSGIRGWLWRNLIEDISVNELMGITIVWFCLAGIAVMGLMFFSSMRKSLRLGIVFCSILGVVTLSAYFWKMNLYQSLAVVTVNADSLFEPRPDATVHFSLTEGSHVVMIKTEDDWVKIRRDDGKMGWLPASSIGPVVLN